MGVELEVLVLDDHSDDATAAIVRQRAAGDTRVRWWTGQRCRPDGVANSTRAGSCAQSVV